MTAPEVQTNPGDGELWQGDTTLPAVVPGREALPQGVGSNTADDYLRAIENTGGDLTDVVVWARIARKVLAVELAEAEERGWQRGYHEGWDGAERSRLGLGMTAPNRPSVRVGGTELGAVEVGPDQVLVLVGRAASPPPPDPGVAQCCGGPRDRPHGLGRCWGWPGLRRRARASWRSS